LIDVGIQSRAGGISKNLVKRSKGKRTTSTGCGKQNSELIGWNNAASMSVIGSEPDM
jgi:hypothetical protein